MVDLGRRDGMPHRVEQHQSALEKVDDILQIRSVATHVLPSHRRSSAIRNVCHYGAGRK